MNELLIERLKAARANNGLKQQEVAERLGIKANTISNWEKGRTEPDIDTFVKLCDIYNVDCATLLSDVYAFKRVSQDISLFEYEHIKKYRSLDPYGQETISIILDREIERVNTFKEQVGQLKSSMAPISSVHQGRLINYYQRLASAGAGQFVFDDIPVELIEIPDTPEYQNVNYAIGVNGASMEPLYYDGDVLLVESAEQISVGEIGIFIVDGQSYVKKLGDNILISLNDDFSNVDIDADTQCLGRVIDKMPRLPELSAADLEALENAANQLSAKKKAQ